MHDTALSSVGRHGARLAHLLDQVTRASGMREAVPVHAPFTGKRLAEIPRGTTADIEEAVARARAAQPAWAARTVTDRARVLLSFHDRLLARQDEVLDLVQLETGKARLDAFEEVADCANVARYYGLRAARLLRPRRRSGAVPLLTHALEIRRPHGVVGCIVPWNYPLNLMVTDALAALVAGNTAVVKPDHQTSLTALWALRLLREAGLPRDVLAVVTGDGAELGPPLIDRVDYMMFTGSTATGRLVARQAAARPIGVSLELGGKNAMIVRADADVDRAVEGALRDCFVGAGQVCVSIERIYVARSVAERFVARFVARTKALRLGAGLDYAADVGSLTSPRQMQRVASHVDDARAHGARVLAGGRPRPDLGPLFYEPTVLADVRPGMLAWADETFGPVVSVYPYETDAEAEAAVNDSPYGLTATLWTADRRAGMALAARLQAGTVNINETYAASWGSVDAPTGGTRQSGLGRRHGREGLFAFTQTQTIAAQRLLPLGVRPGADRARYARLITWALALRRWIPGLG